MSAAENEFKLDTINKEEPKEKDKEKTKKGRPKIVASN